MTIESLGKIGILSQRGYLQGMPTSTQLPQVKADDSSMQDDKNSRVTIVGYLSQLIHQLLAFLRAKRRFAPSAPHASCDEVAGRLNMPT